ncbi:MAG: HD domain-containing phosphohydrolase [Planctomycetota bacterium]
MIPLKTTEDLWLAFACAFDAALTDGARSDRALRETATLHVALSTAFASQANAPIELRMRMSLFVHGERALSDASIRGRTTIALLRRLQVGGIGFTVDVSPASLTELIENCAALFESEAASPEATIRRATGLAGVHLLEQQDDVRWNFLSNPATAEVYSSAGLDVSGAHPIRHEIATTLDEAVAAASAGGEVDLNAARTTAEQMLATSEERFDSLLQLAERPEFDVFTVQHSLRVSLFATYVASNLGAPKEFLIELGAAAMYHDVGKGRIPDEVLYKPGRLDDDERKVMSMHPELGASILLDSDDVSTCALGAAWGHHLRFDGAGYPERRPWFQTTRATSLIQICDVFEALTARRPYKAPYSPARAFQILYSDPGAFDPALLAAFTRALGLFPPGRFALLSDGRLGRVARAGRALDRPVIRTFPRGEMVTLGAPENAHVSVARLLEEPEFMQLLMNGVAAEDIASHAPAPAPEEDGPGRDDEFVHIGQRGNVIPPGGCEHGDGCRLC